jgi:hypothetical protein
MNTDGQFHNNYSIGIMLPDMDFSAQAGQGLLLQHGEQQPDRAVTAAAASPARISFFIT